LTHALDAVATPAERQLLADAVIVLNRLADSHLPAPAVSSVPRTEAGTGTSVAAGAGAGTEAEGAAANGTRRA
jgi:hypothetical protein